MATVCLYSLYGDDDGGHIIKVAEVFPRSIGHWWTISWTC